MTEPHSSLADDLIQSEGGEVNVEKALFDLQDLQMLIAKGDIPEKVAPLLVRILTVADLAERKYGIILSARRQLVTWYCLTRLGVERKGRLELKEILLGRRQEELDQESRIPKLPS